jgi:tRNA threonylcarbamoyladenosine modification (KEOPS) complex Cgi121 subunit
MRHIEESLRDIVSEEAKKELRKTYEELNSLNLK